MFVGEEVDGRSTLGTNETPNVTMSGRAEVHDPDALRGRHALEVGIELMKASEDGLLDLNLRFFGGVLELLPGGPLNSVQQPPSLRPRRRRRTKPACTVA